MTRKILVGVLMLVAAFVIVGLVVGNKEGDQVEQALTDYYAGDRVAVVEDSCSHRGETTSGYERWVCVVQGPASEFSDGPTDQVDVAWNGSKIVRVER